MRFQLPSWLSWYKKPEYRDFKEYATNVSSGRRPLSPDGRNGGIPSRLRLERILANKTCSPMSLYDFYMYLKYIEYSDENLEFYIWFKNYEASYATGLAIDDKDYGSIPSAAQSTSSVARIKAGDSLASSAVKRGDGHDEDDDDDDDDDGNDSEAAKQTLDRISNMISTTALCASSSGPCAFPPPPPPPPPPTADVHLLGGSGRSQSRSKPGRSKKGDRQSSSPSSAASASAELSAVVALFLLPDSPKELNIPPALRDQALADLRRSPHPSALRPVAEHVYSLLRNCSHRNFVRLGVGNGTFETVCVATVLGWANLLAGFAVALCRALATPHRGAHSRWEAWAAWPLWWLGMSLVLSGLRGSCFFLLLFSRRQRLPWERYDDERGHKPEEGFAAADEEKGRGRSAKGGGGGMSENKRVDWLEGRIGGGMVRRLLARVRRLMIFDRRVKVQEKHLRRLQRKIVMQSLAGGAVFATLCVILFIWLPVWKETV